uniref:Methylcytosine dioxygenase TET n=1 Tax=Denticeps clupeoides TaxID=299321 RepID=A0AAY4BFE5_9TELE
MHRPSSGPGPPSQDVYKFSLDDQDTKILLRAKAKGVMSPLTEYIQTEHQHSGFSLPQTDGQDSLGLMAPQRKKRKRCGGCGPCLRKENCGVCSNCMNRKIGHQICKLRKCDQLKKKTSSWEVKDIQAQFLIQNLAEETVSGVASVDGPRGRGQMEIGSHDRLKEGVLNQESANGVSGHTCEEDDLTSGESARGGQQRTGCIPLVQSWEAGPDKTSLAQQEHLQSCWNSHGVGTSVNAADIEDAKNLVAFSASVGSLPPSGEPEPQAPNAQLYEKFNQEMASRGGQARLSGLSVEGDQCPPEDLNTLQIALSQAKHGHKPPNCDCEGPDCPDYLEWLEKKIKQTAGSQEKKHCRLSEALQPDQQHVSQSQTQTNGQSSLCCPQPPASRHQPSTPIGCTPAPIPCSPSVLSIAKEKNISLQTAIAIEALTQLSATVQQTLVPPVETATNSLPHQHIPSHAQHGTHLVSSSSGPISTSTSSSVQQSVPIGKYSQQDSLCWEQHRPQSQREAPSPHMVSRHSSPYPTSASPFSGAHLPTGTPRPEQWQQSSGRSCVQNSPRNPWMVNSEQTLYSQLSHGGSDPMSELKQLLGNTSRKYTNPAFKFPAQNLSSKEKDDHVNLPSIKQEMDSGDYPGSACATMVQNRMVNGQQYPGSPLSPNSMSIKFSTQAALQQHLHHKRKLFSSSPAHGQRAAMSCQDLRKWWPQMESDVLPIKQEPKEPKKKKTPQSSPLIKNAMGGLVPHLGSPLPKPKTIVIKKAKQKASQPLFLPHSQIKLEKPDPFSQAVPISLPQLNPFLRGIETGPASSQSLCTHLSAVVPQLASAQSQESILNRCGPPSTSSNFSENAPSISASLPTTQSQPQDNMASSGPMESGDGTSASSTTPNTSVLCSNPPTVLPPPSLGSLDPKFEELIRQFEEEFGDSNPASGPNPQASARSVVTASQPNSNSGHNRPTSPPTEQPATCGSLPAAESQSMELEMQKDSGAAIEGALPVTLQTPTGCHEGNVSSSGSPLVSFLEQKQSHTLEDPFTTPLPKRMKIESSGGVTVLSTTGCFPTDDGETPTKDGFPANPSLRGFLESPLRYLDTPTKSLLNTPAKDPQAEFPTCDCVAQIVEKDEGPYYNHLGAGPNVASIRELMESRYGEKGEAVRIEKVVYTGKEGKSSQGCPIAKWVIRRSCEAEKLLCLVRHRTGHHCANAVIIIVILAWEGVPQALGDKLYREISDTLTKFGNPTSRRCGLNEDRTCACQGKDPEKSGASFSFGCSWSMYFNGCKYARSKTPRKFRLQGEHPKEEDNLRDNFQNLATHVAPLYKSLAPQAYSNQCQNESTAPDCRLGLKEGRPFSGVTACMDFCAHAHKDQHNLYNGCTVVCTLTREDNRMVGQIPEDEQLHVLPLYTISMTDEFGSEENQRLKMQSGAIQVLDNFRREVRKLPEPAKSCRQRRLEAKKAASEKKKKQLQETPVKTIKTEMSISSSPHPQQGNKAIPKQEVKPNIKKESVDRYQSINGAIPGYLAIGNGQESYGMNNGHSYPGGLSSSSQTPAPGPVNGFHPNLPALPYGYYPPNALFPPELLNYKGQNRAWPKAASTPPSFDKKPDVQSLNAMMAHNQDHPGQQASGATSHCYGGPAPSHTPSPSPDARIGTPVIKEEPMDVPLYANCRVQGRPQSCGPSTPQPDSWHGQKPNGSLMPKTWEGQLRPAASGSPFPMDKQQPPHHAQQPYPDLQQQWISFHGRATPVASPAPSPSPSLKASPSPALTPHHWENPSPSPQPHAWAMGPGTLKHANPAGAFPDKMLSRVGESRGSTPLGLQEKVWKSSGGSVASSTPSPAPEGRLFPHALQQTDAQACWTPCKMDSEVESQGDPEEDEVWSDSEHNFLDPSIGGVAVAPAHGTIMIECARRELHATTPLKKPDRSHPSRISLVFYQHKNLNQPSHGLALWEAKMKLLAERARQRQQEAALLGLSQEEIKAYGKKRKWGTLDSSSPGPGQVKDRREGVVTRLAPTQHTSTTVTVSPFAFTQLTGPYSRFV